MRIEPTTQAPAPAASDPKVERAARGFERLLVRQLAQSLLASARSDDDEDGTTSLYSDMFPDALSDAIEQAGGFGLAGSLTQSLEATP